MTASFLYPACLILHLSGLTVMAGSTLVNYLGYLTFWRLLPQQDVKAEGVLQFLAKFSRVIGIGAALLVSTGVGMMFITSGVYGEQLWFRIKFAIVLLLIANNLFFRLRTGLKLERLVFQDRLALTGDLSAFRRKANTFYLTQLALFFVIILLSVAKFN